MQNKYYTGLSSDSWAFRRLIYEVSILTPKVWFPINIAGSKNQELHISGFPSIIRKTKLNWNWLLLRMFIYLWITGSARQFFPEIQRWNFFVMPCNLRPPPKKFRNMFPHCWEFKTFFLNIMWINLASFSAIL